MSLAKKTAINMKHVVKAPFFLGFVHGKKIFQYYSFQILKKSYIILKLSYISI